jgi:hypothetical protein
MIHTNEYRVLLMAKDRIGEFHQEAEARQLARQALAGRSQFRFGSMVVRLARLPFALAVQFIERPLRNAVFNGAVKFFDLVRRMTGVTREASS